MVYDKIMIELFKALAVGFIVGAVFSLMKLPLPAPPVLAGLLGVVGIYLGMVIVRFFTS